MHLMTGLEPVAKALIAIAANPAVDKLSRQERVIRLLKKFEMAPDVPPRDFDGIYVYTLIEYCYGRPEPVINLFRDKDVRAAFRKTFETGDPSHLDREAEEIIRWNDESGTIGHDFRREFAGFTAMFNALVDRTRGAAEARSDRRREEIHHDLQASLANLRDLVTELPTLEQIRTVAMTPAAGQLDPIRWLANETKGWFDAIGYRLEHHEEPIGDSFTWIINIPARRGYERIVVYGIAGEAGIADARHARSLVEAHRADEGWVLAPRRVSAAAREIADGTVACYTLDELIDQDANFDPYLNWLENEVNHRKIDTNFVPVYCRKEEFDPVSGRTIGQSLYGAERNGLVGYAHGWLTDPSKEHLSVLGEFGTGKSWFCLHFAWELAKQYRTAKQNGLPRPRLPLLIPLRDYAKAVSVESLFSEFFFRRHKVQLSHYSVFEYLNRAGRLLLIFDGFDEMASRVDRQARINNFWELAKVVVPGAKVLLTCRTEHFPEAKESRDLLSAQLKASTQALTGEPPQFEVAELVPFDNDQVRHLLSYIAEPAKVDLIMSNRELLDLMRRPVMSELVRDALPDINEGKQVDLARVYLYAVRRKMSRDIQAERTFTSMGDKLFFLCELSWEMLSTDTMSMNYRQFPDRIRRCFGAAVREDKDLDHWHHDMLGQTMLIRNSDGDYTPAHRSLLEFFVAYKFVAELGLLASDFLGLVKDRDSEGVAERWSEHFLRKEADDVLQPIGSFIPEPIERLADTFGSINLVGAIIDLMLPMLDRERAIPGLRGVIRQTRGQAATKIKWTGANAATLLVRLDAAALRGMSLVGVNLAGARLYVAPDTVTDLSEADLRGAVLMNAEFVNVRLVNADLTAADLAHGRGIGLGHEYPTCLAVDSKNKDVYIGTSTGVLFRWISSKGNVIPTVVAELNSEIQSIEFFRSGDVIAIQLAGSSQAEILNTEAGSRTKFPGGIECRSISQGEFHGIGVTDAWWNTRIYRVPDGAAVANLTRIGRPLGYSKELRKTLFFGFWGDRIEISAVDFLSLEPERTMCGEIHLRPHCIPHLFLHEDRIWAWSHMSNEMQVFDIHGKLISTLPLRMTRDHQLRAVADSHANVAVFARGSYMLAYDISAWEVIWNGKMHDIADIQLMGDGVGVVIADGYGEVAIRDLMTGEKLDSASVNRSVRGARLSRASGLRPEELATLRLAGAVLVD